MIQNGNSIPISIKIKDHWGEIISENEIGLNLAVDETTLQLPEELLDKHCRNLVQCANKHLCMYNIYFFLKERKNVM
jgi:hypothetical protein